MWTLEYTISQICVVLALASMCLSYLTKNKIYILLLSTFSTLFFGIQYGLLGAWTGVAINSVGIVRGIWFYFNDKKGKTNDYISLIILSTALIIVGIATYQSIFSLVATLAMLLFTYTLWQSKVSVYRNMAPFISLLWITYNIYNNSIFAIISESILIVFEIIGIIKYYKKKKKEEKTTPNQQ